MNFKNVILTAALLIPLSSMADESYGINEWIQVSNAEDGQLYILPSSISEDALGHRMMWIKAINVDDGTDVKTLKTLFVFDCRAKKAGVSHFIQLDKNDNIINEQRLPTGLADLRTTDPDGFTYEIMQLICN